MFYMKIVTGHEAGNWELVTPVQDLAVQKVTCHAGGNVDTLD
jgi:hypothetical protein